MLNIHFPVLTNFVMFVYLDVFLIELLLCLVRIALTRHFKDHLKILASTLYHKSCYPENHYQHSISNSTGIERI